MKFLDPKAFEIEVNYWKFKTLELKNLIKEFENEDQNESAQGPRLEIEGRADQREETAS